MPDTMTLQEKVRSILFIEDEPIGTLHSVPAGQKTWRELDLEDWGFAFGIAVGIARGENSFEDIASVAERAFEAATGAYGEFTGGRPVGEEATA